MRPINAQSRTGHRGRRDGNSSQPESAERTSVPIALLRTNTTMTVRTCPVPGASELPCGLIINAVAQDHRSEQYQAAHEHPRAADPAVAHICPRRRRSAYHLATLA